MAEDSYLSLTPQERLELLDEAARQRGLAPAILEKDYWACQMLDALFALPELGSHLVFKGGTSLSKVYGLIDRFSEDVDVSFHREFLGFGEDHDPEAATGKEQNRRIEALQQACKACIRESLLPRLQESLTGLLGSTQGWSLEHVPSGPASDAPSRTGDRSPSDDSDVFSAAAAHFGGAEHPRRSGKPGPRAAGLILPLRLHSAAIPRCFLRFSPVKSRPD